MTNMASANQFLSVSEAASLIKKSTQTIRRMIKNKKIKFRRKRTPQGFTYFIDKDNLLEIYGNELPSKKPEVGKIRQAEKTANEVKQGLKDADLTEAKKADLKDAIKEKIDSRSTFNEDPVDPLAGQARDNIEMVEESDIFRLEADETEEKGKAGLKDLPKEERAKNAEIDIEEIQTEESSDETMEPEVDFSHITEENDKAEKSQQQTQNPELINQNEQAFMYFNNTLQQMINQYDRMLKNQEEDKRNLFKLVGTFQDRIGVLENRIKQLEAPKKKWWQWWK